MSDLTTRQIAERIAQSVFDSIEWNRYEQQCELDATPAGNAVLRTLRENGIWLHRTVQDADGVVDGEAPSDVLPEVEA